MELKRYSGNPVLQASDLSYPASLVFNAGICKFKGRYYMVFRNDVGFSSKGWGRGTTYTNLGIAESDDGIHWIPRDKPWAAPQEYVDAEPEISRFYDRFREVSFLYEAVSRSESDRQDLLFLHLARRE